MSTAHIDRARASVADWRELALRQADGLQVALLWSKSADRVKVSVLDERLGESFDLDIAGADALGAFNHPFAYAAARGPSCGDAWCEPLDLQAQN